MSKQVCEWFIEPQDAQSNEIISRELSEEKFYEQVLCEDGKRRNLWLAPFDLIKFLWKSRSSGLDIKVFNRTVNGRALTGKVRDLTFIFKKKTTKRKTKQLQH